MSLSYTPESGWTTSPYHSPLNREIHGVFRERERETLSPLGLPDFVLALDVDTHPCIFSPQRMRRPRTLCFCISLRGGEKRGQPRFSPRSLSEQHQDQPITTVSSNVGRPPPGREAALLSLSSFGSDSTASRLEARRAMTTTTTDSLRFHHFRHRSRSAACVEQCSFEIRFQ